jgi:hypothetical protein
MWPQRPRPRLDFPTVFAKAVLPLHFRTSSQTARYMFEARLYLLEIPAADRQSAARQQRHRTLAAAQTPIGGVRFYRTSSGSLARRAATRVWRESIRIATAFRVHRSTRAFRTSHRSAPSRSSMLTTIRSATTTAAERSCGISTWTGAAIIGTGPILPIRQATHSS